MIMTKKIIQELENDIKKALDELDYEIPYGIISYTETDNGVKYGICEVEFNLSEFDDSIPDDWDEIADDAIGDVVKNWGGKYAFESYRAIISING